MPNIGQPTPPPYNDEGWDNEAIEPPEVAHPAFIQGDVEAAARASLERRIKDQLTRAAAELAMDPEAYERTKAALVEELQKLRDDVITDVEHEKERHHLRDTNPGMPAPELRARAGLGKITRNEAGDVVRVDEGGWLSGSMRTHPAGRKLEDWHQKALGSVGSEVEGTFQDDLMHLLNRHSIDAQVGVPDFILAHYIVQTIANLSGLQYSNRKWSES